MKPELFFQDNYEVAVKGNRELLYGDANFNGANEYNWFEIPESLNPMIQTALTMNAEGIVALEALFEGQPYG